MHFHVLDEARRGEERGGENAARHLLRLHTQHFRDFDMRERGILWNCASVDPHTGGSSRLASNLHQSLAFQAKPALHQRNRLPAQPLVGQIVEAVPKHVVAFTRGLEQLFASFLYTFPAVLPEVETLDVVVGGGGIAHESFSFACKIDDGGPDVLHRLVDSLLSFVQQLVFDIGAELRTAAKLAAANLRKRGTRQTAWLANKIFNRQLDYL